MSPNPSRRGRRSPSATGTDHARVAHTVGLLVGILYVTALIVISVAATPRTALSVFSDWPGLTRVCDPTATPSLALSGVPLQTTVTLPAWCTVQHAAQLTPHERLARILPDDER